MAVWLQRQIHFPTSLVVDIWDIIHVHTWKQRSTSHWLSSEKPPQTAAALFTTKFYLLVFRNYHLYIHILTLSQKSTCNHISPFLYTFTILFTLITAKRMTLFYNINVYFSFYPCYIKSLLYLHTTLRFSYLISFFQSDSILKAKSNYFTCSRKNFKSLFSAGIVLAVGVSNLQISSNENDWWHSARITIKGPANHSHPLFVSSLASSMTDHPFPLSPQSSPLSIMRRAHPVYGPLVSGKSFFHHSSFLLNQRIIGETNWIFSTPVLTSAF